jgi:hypothetical protein
MAKADAADARERLADARRKLEALTAAGKQMRERCSERGLTNEAGRLHALLVEGDEVLDGD